jgi:hypothetical protein
MKTKVKTKSISFVQAAVMVMVMATALFGWTATSSTALAAARWDGGDGGLIEKELRCQHQLSTPGYYSSLVGAEVADAQRSALFPCADFLGSFHGNNQVSAQMSPNIYQQGISMINNRQPGQTYLVGGNNPPLTGSVQPGPYVARVNPTTGAQIWRTTLDEANVTHHFIATTNLNILADGTIAEAWSHYQGFTPPPSLAHLEIE